MFNSSNKELRSDIEDLQNVIMDIGHQMNIFKREVRSDIANLQVQLHELEEKHDAAVCAGSTAVEQLKFDIGNIRDLYRQVDKWDDENRDKLKALMDYFEINFKEGYSVVEREEED